MTIFVDIDGVLCDFVATLENFGVILPEICDYSFKQENISASTVANVFLVMENSRYATEGVPCQKAINYFKNLSTFEDVRVLTARKLHQDETVNWIRRHFGDFEVKFTNYPKSEFLWLGDKLWDDCPNNLKKPGSCVPCRANKKQAYFSDVLKDPDMAYNFTDFS